MFRLINAEPRAGQVLLTAPEENNEGFAGNANARWRYGALGSSIETGDIPEAIPAHTLPGDGT